MKRWPKRITFCAGGLALLLLLFAVEEHTRGALALHRNLSALKANGEEYSPTALEPRHPSGNQNVFTDLTNIATQLEAMVKHLEDAPPSLHFAAPGKGIVSWRLNQWGQNTKTTNDWSRLGPELDQARDLLGLLHSAVRKPAYDSGFDYAKGFVDFRLGGVAKAKRSTEILGDAALYELHRGNMTAAGDHLCAMVKLAADQAPEPLVICQLIRIACATMAFNETWQALQAPGWNDAQLTAMQTAWEGCDFAGDMGSAMEMERALTFDYYEQIKSSRAKLAFVASQRESADEVLTGLTGSPLPTHGFLLNWVHLPFWRLAWADQEELFALNQWRLPIEREKFAHTNGWSALSSRSSSAGDNNPILFLGSKGEMGWYDRLRFPFASVGFSVNDNEIRRAICVQVQQRMAITAIAVYRYRLQTGVLPANLSALVPKYLSALPRDDMDGKTLRYGLQPATGFLLYSVGLDGKDDDGDSRAVAGKKKLIQIWDARDAVWPAPCTNEEALAAMRASND